MRRGLAREISPQMPGEAAIHVGVLELLIRWAPEALW